MKLQLSIFTDRLSFTTKKLRKERYSPDFPTTPSRASPDDIGPYLGAIRRDFPLLGPLIFCKGGRKGQNTV